MISKELHNKLINKWSKIGKIYQGRNKRVVTRLRWFDKHLTLLDGLNVLEVGCNAGLFAIGICKHCSWYVGLEPKENYYKQALITKEYINHSLGLAPFHADVAFFFNRGLKDYFDKDKNWLMPNKKLMAPNALILSRVLYYLTNEDIEALKVILKTCKYALVFCGSAKDRGNNKYGFHKAENVGKFFEDNGFKFEVDLVHERYFAGVALK